MSSHYTTEPAPTASATLNTTFGPLHISLFATQTPLTCRNFLQHCMDNYYAGTIFHRVVPDFIIQGGDPTGTGSGGTSIYEYPEFEYDPDARDPNEKVVLRDEMHSRLRYNRRGLVGMAKSEDGSYGSQFFITLANTERELNGQCTLFGRIEGDSLYNMLKIADAERVEGTERPVYPVKITSCEVGELGPLTGKVKKRQVTATGPKTEEKPAAKKKKKAKTGKVLLSFGRDDEDGDENILIRPAKPKFNPTLVTDANIPEKDSSTRKGPSSEIRRRPRSPSPKPVKRQPSPKPQDRPKTPDHANQLPLPDPESPERSPTPEQPRQSFLSRTNAEIENLKASMRRTVQAPAAGSKPKSVLEAMIPETAIRGRKRPAPGSVNVNSTTSNGITGFSSSSSTESETLKMFNAFKAKLETSGSQPSSTSKHTPSFKPNTTNNPGPEEEDADEESQLCDLHFIANCQSCKSWDDETGNTTAGNKQHDEEANDADWLHHQLHFGKDTLGKDLKWKKEHQDADSLMVIDPRQKEKEISGGSGSGRKRGLERDRERERKKGRVGEMEWSR
ncbi:cyclophilin-like domain-containing protein [Aspergillus crustosus]